MQLRTSKPLNEEVLESEAAVIGTLDFLRFEGFSHHLRRAKSRYRKIASELRFESLAFVGGHISPQKHRISPHRACVRCAAIRIARLALTRLTFIPHGIAEWLARVDPVRWTLAIGDWRFCPSKVIIHQYWEPLPQDHPSLSVGRCFLLPSALNRKEPKGNILENFAAETNVLRRYFR